MMISSEFMRLSFWPLHTTLHSYDTNHLEFVSASGNCNQQYRLCGSDKWIKRISSCGIIVLSGVLEVESDYLL